MRVRAPFHYGSKIAPEVSKIKFIANRLQGFQIKKRQLQMQRRF
jgi:hypothetical protein